MSRSGKQAPDWFVRNDAAHPFDSGTIDPSKAPDVFERYAAAHPFGRGIVDSAQVPDVYVLYDGEQAARRSWLVAEAFRDGGLAVVRASAGGFKGPMKKADQSGARFAVFLGPDELKEQLVTLKPLRGQGRQLKLAVPAAIAHVKQSN